MAAWLVRSRPLLDCEVSHFASSSSPVPDSQATGRKVHELPGDKVATGTSGCDCSIHYWPLVSSAGVLSCAGAPASLAAVAIFLLAQSYSQPGRGSHTKGEVS
jgi:hypothetical protein